MNLINNIDALANELSDTSLQHAWEDGCEYYNYFPRALYAYNDEDLQEKYGEQEHVWVSEEADSPYSVRRDVGMTVTQVAESLRKQFANRYDTVLLRVGL